MFPKAKDLSKKLKNKPISTIFVISVLLILSFILLTPGINTILLGAVFAYLVRPISKKLEPFLKFRSFSVVIAMIVLILPLILIIWLLLNQIFVIALATIGATDITNLNYADNLLIYFNNLVDSLPPYLQPIVNPVVDDADRLIIQALNTVASYLFELISYLPNLLISTFVFIASVFYLARDGDRIWKYIMDIIPEDEKEFFSDLFSEMENILKSIFFGYFLTALIIGAIAGVGYFLLGYEFAILLGTLTAIFELLPITGPWIVYWSLLIYDLLTGNYIRIIFVLFLALILSGSDVYIRPKLTGQYAEIHPLIFLFGFIFGVIVFGVVGLVIGPLILGITYAVLNAYRKKRK